MSPNLPAISVPSDLEIARRATLRPLTDIPLCGDMRTMPGLSSEPAAERIDIDENGDIIGLL